MSTAIPSIPVDHIVNKDKSVRRKMIDEAQEHYRGQLTRLFLPFFSTGVNGEKLCWLVDETLRMSNYTDTLAAYLFEVPVCDFLQRQKENDPLTWKILCLRHLLHDTGKSLEEAQKKIQERLENSFAEQETEPVVMETL